MRDTRSQLDALSDPIVRVYEEIVDQVLISLARHFNVTADGPTGSFSYEAALLAKLGAVTQETAAVILRKTGGVDGMTELAIRQSMLAALEDAEPELLRMAQAGLLSGTRQTMHETIEGRLRAYSSQAKDQLNLVNTVMLEGTKEAYRQGVYAASDILRQMESVQAALNAETGKVIAGASAMQQASRAAVRRMQAAGITGFVDRGGRKWSAEAYARMDIKTTCSNAAAEAVRLRNEAYGNDLISVRVNATARPGCYPWQGKVISTTDNARTVHDLHGRALHAYARSETTWGQPDGIFGINCHHGPPQVFLDGYSVVRGEAPDRQASDARYAMEQEQRRLEREVRYAKREAAMLDAAGDREGFEAAALKVKQKQGKLKAFVAANENLVLHNDRTQVFGYNRSVSRKAILAAKKKESNDIVVADLRAAGVKGTIHINPTPVDISVLSFDNQHINTKRGHGITEEQAKSFISHAKASVTVWGGQYERYYAADGAAYVDVNQSAIRTAFGKEQFDERTRNIMEVLERHGK